MSGLQLPGIEASPRLRFKSSSNDSGCSYKVYVLIEGVFISCCSSSARLPSGQRCAATATPTWAPNCWSEVLLCMETNKLRVLFLTRHIVVSTECMVTKAETLELRSFNGMHLQTVTDIMLLMSRPDSGSFISI